MNILHITIYALCIAILFAISYRPLKQKIRFHRWQKALHLRHHEEIFNTLYKDIDGFSLSKQARQHNDAMEYIYGEIEFLPFIALLSLIHLDEQSVFYDLGSGTGKAVLACAMVYPVKKCVGIELFPELFSSALEQKNRLSAIQGYQHAAQNIEFILGSFLDVSLMEATTVFINASAFFGDTWDKLCTKLDTLPFLTTVITTSKSLKSTKFEVSKVTTVMMSWGPVLAYIHSNAARNL